MRELMTEEAVHGLSQPAGRTGILKSKKKNAVLPFYILLPAVFTVLLIILTAVFSALLPFLFSEDDSGFDLAETVSELSAEYKKVLQDLNLSEYSEFTPDWKEICAVYRVLILRQENQSLDQAGKTVLLRKILYDMNPADTAAHAVSAESYADRLGFT